MKQVLTTVGLSFVIASQPKNSHNRNLDRVYASGGIGLDKIEVLFGGGENLVAGLSRGSGNVPIFYQSFTETDVDGVYSSALYSMNSFAITPIDTSIDQIFPNAVALVWLLPLLLSYSFLVSC